MEKGYVGNYIAVAARLGRNFFFLFDQYYY